MPTVNRFGKPDMPGGPKRQYRPNDPVAAAAAVVRIATGESDEATETTRGIAAAKKELTKSQPPKAPRTKPTLIDH
jgi:hypothetical protein